MGPSYLWVYPTIVTGLWLAWLAYWIVSSQAAKETARAESAVSRGMHLVPVLAGAFLIGGAPQFFARWPWLSMHVLPWNLDTYWWGVALLAGGLAFTVWARVHLGRNWSGIVTLKQGHELVRSGPYRWVRHPIYTGLIIAFLGTAVAYNALRCFLGVVLCAAAFVLKLHVEERFMRERFGEEYSRYAASTAALLPLVY
jgi:protein-S-isoprenylcysteine O-methyltransferase Ste14